MDSGGTMPQEEIASPKVAVPEPHVIAFIGVMVVVLAFSAYFRVNSPHANQPTDDEFYTMIPAVKLNVPHPNYDPRMFNFHHPFFGFKLMGALIDRGKAYTNTVNIPPNLLYWSYMAAPELRDEEKSMRFMTALFGMLLLIPVFLIGRELYGNIAGLLAASLTGISVGFINLSRVAFQDAFLPFFMFMAMYFGMKYLKADEKEKVLGVDKALVNMLLALVFLYLSFIVRIGQPLLVFLALVLAVFIRKGKKYAWVFLYSVPIMATVVLLSFGVEPIMQMLSLRGGKVIEIALNTGFIQGAVAQGAYASTLMLAFTAYLVAADFLPKPQKMVFSGKLSLREIRDRLGLSSTSEARDYIERNYEYNREGDSYTVLEKKAQGFMEKLSTFFWGLESGKKFLLMTFALLLLAAIFTETGSTPRLYLFIFILPIIFVAGKIVRFSRHVQYMALSLALLADTYSLYAANPNFNEYTVFGIQPIYILNFKSQYMETLDFLSDENGPKVITNEPGLLLRYANSEPLPPNYRGFSESENCNDDYFRAQKGNILVYRRLEYDLNSNQYICPAIRNANLVPIKNVSDGAVGTLFEIYRFS